MNVLKKSLHAMNNKNSTLIRLLSVREEGRKIKIKKNIMLTNIVGTIQ